MDFKTTSSINKSSLQCRLLRASTLVELLMAIGISSILILAVGATIIYSGRSFAGVVNYIDLDRKSRYALDIMSQQIRGTSKLKTFAADRLVFVDEDGADLEFSYDSSTRKLNRVKGGTTNTLLTECDSLSFDIFQRNPVPGTFAQYSTASNAALCKVVQVNWNCSRKVLGNKMNTESVQTAKIVIRN